ncbi:biopolymer transporter ExbD [Paraliomyxa miuraensis]|uniref:biopolymer transporter ExbD n=1 Tax=Paraliomyxa miuraensis TaxID=376150 RepID=UPI0022526491|nr:biopolymer transporter ExbD [Paraliomyxa miuraensis]MCX4244050.1 biopolymer transporter ExbD [Paraliomyxa miuraensis]
MFKRAKKKNEDGEVEANMIPVLSTMFLLIPALLLAMEIAPFTSVRVEPPKFSQLQDPSPTDQPQERLRFRVQVRQDGFTVRYGSKPESERTVDIPLGGDGKHDFAALEQRASELKALFPEDPVVNISAENAIGYGTLVESMDALRGRDCSLKSALYGESVPQECLFWNVVVESGTV